MTQYKHFEIADIQGVSVMRLQDIKTADDLLVDEVQSEMVAYAKSEIPKKLVIDFTFVKSFSSEVINALLKVRDWVVGNDGRLILCAMAPNIRQVFQISNLDGNLFTILETLPDAIKAIRGSQG